MSDATMKDFGELAGCVALGVDPILPKPHWGQDAAMIGFLIDSLRDEIRELRPAKQVGYLDPRVGFYPHGAPPSEGARLTHG